MKNILTLAVCAAVSTTATAQNTIFGDVSQQNKKGSESSVTINQDSQNKTGLQGHHKMENGLIIGAKSSYNWNGDNEGVTDTAIGAAFRFNFNDNFYIMPQAIITKHNTNTEAGAVESTNFANIYAGSYEQGNSWELGLQSGYHLDNGLFITGRYGYSATSSNLNISPLVAVPHSDMQPGFGFDENVKMHKLNITAGYEIANVAVLSASYNYSHTAEDVAFNDKVDPGFSSPSNMSGSGKELELKVSYIGLGNVKPFVAYTVKDDYDFKGAPAFADPVMAELAKAENVFSLGVTWDF